MTTKYDVFELVLNGPSEGNPFTDVDLSAEFFFLNRKKIVSGFYDGDGIYKIRFMPETEGTWTYITKSNISELDGKQGTFTCGPAVAKDHGPVRVKDRFHFAHADGTKFIPVGTTAYAWTNQEPRLIAETLETLSSAPFNKIRMCVFPKHYNYNNNEPSHYAFEGGPAGTDEKGALKYEFDFTRFVPQFFRDLEENILKLKDMGIEVDLIIFHPYDRWGFAYMDEGANQRYLRYLVARLGSFSNIWWSLANEWDLFRHRKVEDWEGWAKTIVEWDASDHLLSIHNCNSIYDQSRGWITHFSFQRVDFHSHVELTAKMREQYGKPVVIDEIGYEGNLDHGWGNLTGEELTKRFWDTTIRGGYCTHGETYYNEEEEIWWAKGGKLIGTSPARIQFLRDIVESAPGYIDPKPSSPMDWDLPWGYSGKRISYNLETRYGKMTMSAAEYMLCYFSFSRPIKRTFMLPADVNYKVDVIDTWNMTIDTLPGVYSGNCTIKLPSKTFIAVRFQAVD